MMLHESTGTFSLLKHWNEIASNETVSFVKFQFFTYCCWASFFSRIPLDSFFSTNSTFSVKANLHNSKHRSRFCKCVHWISGGTDKDKYDIGISTATASWPNSFIRESGMLVTLQPNNTNTYCWYLAWQKLQIIWILYGILSSLSNTCLLWHAGQEMPRFSHSYL